MVIMKGFASSKMYDFTITRYGIWNSEGAGGGRTSLAFEYGVMAYCIALGIFWTYHYLLGDLVAHGLGRRNRIFGIWDVGDSRKMGGNYAAGLRLVFFIRDKFC